MKSLETSTIDKLRPWFADLDLTRIRIVEGGPMCWYVRKVVRQGAMTIAPFIFYGLERLDPDEAGSLALLAHELNHVRQYRRFGHAGFLARYFRDMARNRFRYDREKLPLEAECYALQAEVRSALRPAAEPAGADI